MDQTIVGCVLAVVAVAGLSYSVVSRVAGFHRPTRWYGGGTVTLTGAISGWAFIGFSGTVLLTNNSAWVAPTLLAWFVGYVSQTRANRRYREDEEQLREQNALKYPGVFDVQPPIDIDAVPDEELDLYDAGACTFIGTVGKADICVLIDAFSDMPDQGPNDLFIIHESMEMVPELSPHCRTQLEDALLHRDFLVLRWLPQSQKAR